MPKLAECAGVDPSTGCQHVVRGETEEEVLRDASDRYRQVHGVSDKVRGSSKKGYLHSGSYRKLIGRGSDYMQEDRA